MQKRFVAYLLIGPLAACQSPEEIQVAKENRMRADYQTCVEDYGFKAKSDAARNCMLQIELNRENQENYAYGASYWDRHPFSGSGVYFMNRY